MHKTSGFLRRSDSARSGWFIKNSSWIFSSSSADVEDSAGFSNFVSYSSIISLEEIWQGPLPSVEQSL